MFLRMFLPPVRAMLLLALFALPLTVLASAALAQFAPAPSAPASEEAAPEGREGYSTLADMLENEQTRAELIEQLRRLAAPAATTPVVEEDVSFARQIARTTHGIAEMVVDEVGDLYQHVAGFEARSVTSEGIRDLGQAVLALAVVIVAVAFTVWLLRLVASRLYRRASAWVEKGAGARPWMRRGTAALGCGFVDFAIVMAGWLVGYAAALFLLGEGGRMDTRQSLFLNAFLVVETIKVIIRLFFATRYDGLRLLPVRAEDAAYWNAWLSRLVGFIGYSILLVVPIVSFNLGSAAGYIISAVVYLLALVVAIIIIRQNREAASARLATMAERSQFGFVKLALGTLARIWHLLAIAYLTLLAVLLLVRPETALTFMVAATVQSIVAIVGGMLVSALIDKAISFGIRLNPKTRSQFPMLEERLNAFVPNTLKAVRIIIGIVVLALILDAWSIFDFFTWVGSEAGIRVVGTIATVAFIIMAATAFWLVVASWIEYRLNLGQDGASVAASSRERTLLTIFRNAFTIALVVMVSMITLSELGLDIGPLLAGAGVLGLAIGFGAQKLVQDVITGIFIQLENAMNTGDVVAVGGTSGVVEKLTVRSVGIRDLSGTYHLIPFSSVDTVSNFMRGFSFHVGEYGVAYRENVDDVIEVLKKAFEELKADPAFAPSILGDMEVHGITEFAESSVTVRIRIKTLPGQHWGLGRHFNGLVKKYFDAAGIEIPFPHVTLYFGEDKKGEAPPAPIRIIGNQGGDAAAVPDEEPKPALPSAGDTSVKAPRVRRAGKAKRNPPAGEGRNMPSDDEADR